MAILNKKSTQENEEYDRPSKSQRKREMTALQKLGETLVNTTSDKLKNIVLPDNLREAIDLCRKIKSHEGRRRQLQFIGKIMRGLDEEIVLTIKNTFDNWSMQTKADIAAMHAIEDLRDQLLEREDAITDFLDKNPTIDATQLRQLIRSAKKEKAENKPPKAYRKIFQLIKAISQKAPYDE